MLRRIAIRFQMSEFVLILINSFDYVLISLYQFSILLHISNEHIIQPIFSIYLAYFDAFRFKFEMSHFSFVWLDKLGFVLFDSYRFFALQYSRFEYIIRSLLFNDFACFDVLRFCPTRFVSIFLSSLTQVPSISFKSFSQFISHISTHFNSI